MNARAEPPGRIRHAIAEHSVDADHNFVAVFEQIHQRGFHPGRTGTGNRESDLVGGAENDA